LSVPCIAGKLAQMTDLNDLDLVDAAKAIRTKQISCLELAEESLRRCAAAQNRLNCLIRLDSENAIEDSRAADAALARGDAVGPLHGVPLAHKDMFYRAGKITTCGSKIRREFVPDYTATTLKRLDAAGALHIATLNMSEFAYSPTGHNIHYGDCHNPWSTHHIPGGSSSGSAAAVAARLVFGALGSDTAGSVRLPAALCGVVGMKPTFGRVSRNGAMPVSFSLDVVGPLARTVKDCALLYQVIAGPDADDPTTSNEPLSSHHDQDIESGLRGLRIGVPTTYFFENMTDEIGRLFDAAIDLFQRVGAEIVEVSPPGLEEMAALANVILGVEAATIHSHWFRTRPQDYSDLVRARIEFGYHHPGTRYLEALMLRAFHLNKFGETVLNRVDAMLAPIVPIPVPTLDETNVGGSKEMPATVGLLTRCGRPINYLGLPSLTIPAGFTANGLPFGVQLVGRPFNEAILFRIGRAYEREAQWYKRRPPEP
jgi:aspartyl-tRNA(Asn)/glutamyl-tRNA(Gln) amidotransferase subunit A